MNSNILSHKGRLYRFSEKAGLVLEWFKGEGSTPGKWLASHMDAYEFECLHSIQTLVPDAKVYPY